MQRQHLAGKRQVVIDVIRPQTRVVPQGHQLPEPIRASGAASAASFAPWRGDHHRQKRSEALTGRARQKFTKKKVRWRVHYTPYKLQFGPPAHGASAPNALWGRLSLRVRERKHAVAL